jgi:hypothetical protein
MTAPDVIVPNFHKSLKACSDAWHMPMSSVWMMTTRSVFEKPNFWRNGFGAIDYPFEQRVASDG